MTDDNFKGRIQTLANYSNRYGDPVLRFLTNATKEDNEFSDIPYECCVFKIDHPSKIMVVSRYSSVDDYWNANYGERAVINFLLAGRSSIDAEKIVDAFCRVHCSTYINCDMSGVCERRKAFISEVNECFK